MSGNMYQLRFRTKQPIGSSVTVNGPYDMFGYVLSHEDTNEHGTLHLIRGTGNQELRSQAYANFQWNQLLKD